MMANDQLDRYRRAVDDEGSGTALETILAELAARKLTNEAPGLKTAPRGYRRDHPRVGLLRQKSVAVMRRFPPAHGLGTPAAPDRIVEVWRAATPMTGWLAEHVGPSTEPPPDRR